MKLPTGRQVIAWIVIAFIVYAVFTAPANAADTTASVWGTIKDGFGSMTTFFDTLLKS